MRIRDLLDVRSIRLDGVANDKADVLNQMVELMSKSGKINDVETYRKGVFAREEEGTTGIGEGIAIPHCKSKAVSKPGLAAMVVPDGVEYEALDGAPVNLLFLIAAPDTKENVHLDVLSKLSVLLMNENFTNGLKNAKSVEEFMTVIDRFENEKDEETVEKNNGYDVVAVTACPTGIAHTYMAAEALEKKAASGGIGHQIYTHLMNGVSHMLPFVIGGGILIALAFLVDTIMGYGTSGGGNFGTCTPLSAFLKYVGGLAMGLMVPVLAGYIAESIADRPGLAVGFAGGLLASGGNAALSGYIFADAKLTGIQGFIATFAFQSPTGGATVSGFLGGILAGFLAGYIILLLKKLFANIPASLDGIKPTLIYPLLGILILGILMCFIFNPLIGLINTGLSDMLKGIADANMLPLLGLILGAMMAIDMGGPINKAAYVFGTGMLGTAQTLLDGGASISDPQVQACYVAMAAIMAGGMVPPVGIALACKLFPKKFTKDEKNSWVSNLIMGASFITEGAIPFAAADPAHVIPCTFVGAGVAGCLTAVFKCTLMAPHGGVFVFATVGNAIPYIIAWAAGSVVTCLMLGFVKKDAE